LIVPWQGVRTHLCHQNSHTQEWWTFFFSSHFCLCSLLLWVLCFVR
jgi:hypothetical protein